MEKLRIEFGLILAYLIPGLVAAWAGSFHLPGLEDYLYTLAGNEVGVVSAVGGALVVMAIGMVVSCFRGATLDRTYKLGRTRDPNSNPKLGQHWLRLADWVEGADSSRYSSLADPDFGSLLAPGALEAHHSAVDSLKRPSQFYGNLALSLAALLLASLSCGMDIFGGEPEWPILLIESVVVIVVIAVLVGSARNSACRYVIAKASILTATVGAQRGAEREGEPGREETNEESTSA